MPPRLLLVENDRLVSRAFARALSRLGLEVTPVPSAAAAFEQLSARAFELVLTDYDLGAGATGLEVLERARELQPRCARVLVTANPDVPHIASAPPGLATRLLVKPVPRGDLARVLELLVEDEPGR